MPAMEYMIIPIAEITPSQLMMRRFLSAFSISSLKQHSFFLLIDYLQKSWLNMKDTIVFREVNNPAVLSPIYNNPDVPIKSFTN
tara:strand:- start:199 stop:450 length:252 start_codon:yes stop_codon:yes gene_type:complete